MKSGLQLQNKSTSLNPSIHYWFLPPITGVEPACSQFCPGRGTGWTRGISSRWSISLKETQWGGPVTSCPPDGDPGARDVSRCCGHLEAKRMAMPRSRADAESGGGNKGIRTGHPRHYRPIWGHPVTGLPLREITSGLVVRFPTCCVLYSLKLTAFSRPTLREWSRRVEYPPWVPS